MYTRSQRTRYRRELRRNLDIFETYLDHAEFRDEGTVGVELELNLVDAQDRPALTSPQILRTLDDEDFVHEIGAFNLETNLPVTSLGGQGLRGLEGELSARMRQAERAAEESDTHVLAIGHLPTLTQDVLSDASWRSPGTRYAALDASVLDARGEEIHLLVEGEGSGLDVEFDSVAPEAACTSMQLHLQVAPEKFAATWNAAQAIAGPQVALAANSPFLLGRRLWHETRIPAFTQSIDTRPPEYAEQGVRPRVWFGERWITSFFDLFEENVRFFPALIPESREMAAEPLLTEGAAPRLHELMLHNGTVWRWNRPIYDPGTDLPHLRIENRLLPSGPTAIDMAANAAFFYGLVHHLVDERRPLWSRMAFPTARDAFTTCARRGLEARIAWPRLGSVQVSDLLTEQLIPRAIEGLRDLGVDEDLIERHEHVLMGRAASRRTGARWQIDTVATLEREGLDRAEALAAMTELYRGHMWSDRPVHEWPIGR
ncbi:glutamate--cysteine ligase [Brachybacterium sp. AOP25-B2-12]